MYCRRTQSIIGHSGEGNCPERLQEGIEALVDQSTLADVLAALAVVCWQKAQHIDEAWQDPVTSKCWHQAGHKIDKLSVDV